FWELRHPNPIVNFRPLRERNFASCCIIIFFAYAVLYGASTSLPGLLQSLFGYDALNAGLVMSPSGFFAVLAMPVVAGLLGRGTVARWRERCRMADRRWVVCYDGRQLLDVATEPGYRPQPSCLASGSSDPGAVDMLCTFECGCLSLHFGDNAWTGCRFIESS